ncbi:MAG: lysophospholipid acyltransferase family protein [Fastidiosipilaceae bacterium]|jgi:1-acyl-sn-glycerol-3-phosphate acyltransferase
MDKDKKATRSNKKELPDNMNRGMRLFIKRSINLFLHLFFRIRYINKENLPVEGPALVIANHKSLLDIPALCVNVEPWFYFVAKKELYNSWIGSRFLPWWGAVQMDRDNVGMGSVREIMGLLRRNKHVMMFPQGTRVKDESRREDYPAHSGTMLFATKLKAPVVPVCIKGKFRLFGRVDVVFGKPMYLRPMPKGANSKELRERMNEDLMRFIYDLGDHPDTATPPASIAYSMEELAELKTQTDSKRSKVTDL